MESSAYVILIVMMCLSLVWVILRGIIAMGARQYDQALKKLEDSDFRLYYYILNDVMAVTSKESFESSLSANLERNQPWEEQVVNPLHTFTFSGQEASRRGAHTGLRSEFEEMLDEKILHMTGLNPAKLADTKWQESLREALLIRDKRLSVPFANEKYGLADYNYHGHQTMSEAWEHLFPGSGHTLIS